MTHALMVNNARTRNLVLHCRVYIYMNRENPFSKRETRCTSRLVRHFVKIGGSYKIKNKSTHFSLTKYFQKFMNDLNIGFPSFVVQ